MKEYKAKSLEEAYELAKLDLNCSITQLDIEVIQSNSNGFLGFFTKDAIIKARIKRNSSKREFTRKRVDSKNTYTPKIKKDTSSVVKKIPKNSIKKEKIFNSFYDNGQKNVHNNITIKKDKDIIIKEIKEKINSLFSLTCYNLKDIKVDFYNEETIYIEFQGDDVALLIGKEGYRYKALSYILFNWIHEKYSLMLRLEVAEFLSTQEEAIYSYLEPVIQSIKSDGYYKTKPLDGVLVHIALKKLRGEFPEKYVAVKTNIKGDKYILVNEYKK